jgi:hypothetical protein
MTISQISLLQVLITCSIVFNDKGTVAYVTSHGSWNKDNPDGYLVFALEFANGEPTHPANSTDAIIPILANVNNSGCPDNCFRPVALAFDKKGRLFVSADESGDIYVITRSDGGSVDDMETASGSSTPKSGASKRKAFWLRPSLLTALFVVLSI